MRKIAVVGAGVSGLTAAYLLRSHSQVTVYESEPRLGGHAHTHAIDDPRGRLGVDSGFIVHNRATYPDLLRLFAELEIETQPTQMSMSISCEGCGLEFSGGQGPRGVLAQPWRVGSPRFVRMLTEVSRFHRLASAHLCETTSDDLIFGEFCTQHGFSDYFVHHFAIPLVSCVWSSGHQDTMAYPARYLFEFLDHHRMLQVKGSPPWYTVTGGSQVYVAALADSLKAAGNVMTTSAAVTSIRRSVDGVEIESNGQRNFFAHVVIATHADTALEMLVDQTPSEKEILGAFSYSENTTVLHSDATHLPRVKAARGSWNFRRASCGDDEAQVDVTYWMNRLQRLDADDDYLVSLNATRPIKADSVIATMNYSHPSFSPKSVAAQQRLASLNTAQTAFAGAYHGWGFHQDGCASGVRAAEHFGGGWKS